MRKAMLAAAAILLASVSTASAHKVPADVKGKIERKIKRIGVTKYDHITWHPLSKRYKVDDAVIGGVKYDIFISKDLTKYKKRKELLQLR